MFATSVFREEKDNIWKLLYDSKNNKKVQTVFKGICVMLEMNKNKNELSMKSKRNDEKKKELNKQLQK